MAQINRYDGTHITNNVTRLVESVIDVAKQKKSLETSERNARVAAQAHLQGTMYSADVASETAKRNTDVTSETNKEIAKLRADTDKDIAYIRANLERELKNMGFNYDIFMEAMKHANIKNRMAFEEEMQERLEQFKQPLMLDRLEREYQNNLKLANFNADEALFRTIVGEMGDIIENSTVLTAGEKTLLLQGMIAASGAIFNSAKGQRRWNDYGYGMINSDKTMNDPRGVLNNEENKPGWELRKAFSATRSWEKRQVSNQRKTIKGRSQGFTNDIQTDRRIY